MEGDYILTLPQNRRILMKVNYKKIDDLILEKIVDVYGEWVKKYIFIRDDTFALAAIAGDLPVGFICVTPRALKFPLEHISDAFIEEYQVHENYQRQGIGRYMVGCAEDWAKQAGFKQIRTHHNNTAVAAILMSKSLGYTMCPHDYNVNGEKHSGYWVAKTL